MIVRITWAKTRSKVPEQRMWWTHVPFCPVSSQGPYKGCIIPISQIWKLRPQEVSVLPTAYAWAGGGGGGGEEDRDGEERERRMEERGGDQLQAGQEEKGEEKTGLPWWPHCIVASGGLGLFRSTPLITQGGFTHQALSPHWDWVSSCTRKMPPNPWSFLSPRTNSNHVHAENPWLPFTCSALASPSFLKTYQSTFH